jgi:twitching motility protein PilT
MGVKELLQLTVERNASDLHVISGIAPTIRVDGDLIAVPNEAVMTPESVAAFLKEALTAEQLERLTVNKEIDFSLAFSEKARFRVNAYTQRGSLAAAF